MSQSKEFDQPQLSHEKIIQRQIQQIEKNTGRRVSSSSTKQFYYPTLHYYTNIDKTPTVQRKDNCRTLSTANDCECKMTCRNDDEDISHDKLIQNILKAQQG